MATRVLIDKGPCKYCEQPARVRQMCYKHHKRVLQHGDPHTNKKIKYQGVGCSKKSCVEQAISRGMCSKHYQQFLRSPDSSYGAWNARSDFNVTKWLKQEHHYPTCTSCEKKFVRSRGNNQIKCIRCLWKT